MQLRLPLAIGMLAVAACASAFGQNRDFHAERLVIDDGNGNTITIETPGGPIIGGTLTVPDPAGSGSFLISNPSGGSQTVFGHLLPGTTATYDLGSSLLLWRDLFLSGTLSVNAILNPSGPILLNDSVQFNGISLFGPPAYFNAPATFNAPIYTINGIQNPNGPILLNDSVQFNGISLFGPPAYFNAPATFNAPIYAQSIIQNPLGPVNIPDSVMFNGVTIFNPPAYFNAPATFNAPIYVQSIIQNPLGPVVIPDSVQFFGVTMFGPPAYFSSPATFNAPIYVVSGIQNPNGAVNINDSLTITSPFNAVSSGNEIGNGLDAEQLQINGVNGGTVEVDINGDVDISGTLTTGSFSTGAGVFTLNGDLDVNGNDIVDGTDGDVTILENLSMTGSVIPTADNTFALGSDALRWSEAYVAGTSVHIGPANGEAGNTEMNLGYVAGVGRINHNGGPAEIEMLAAQTNINADPASGNVTVIGNSTNGSDVHLQTDNGANVFVQTAANAGGVQIGNGVTNGGITLATPTGVALVLNNGNGTGNTFIGRPFTGGANAGSGSVFIEAGTGNTVEINTNATGNATTNIGRTATGTTNLNSPVITMANITAGAATDNVVTTDGTQLFETSVATLIGDEAWLIGGNTLAGAGAIGANSDHALNIETNGTTRMTVANNAGGGDVNILTDLDVDGTLNADGATTLNGDVALGDSPSDDILINGGFNASDEGNVIGNGADVLQLQIIGTVGGAVEVDVIGDVDIDGTLTLAATAAQGDALIASTNAGTTTIDAARIGAGLTDAQVDNDLTINGGTVDATPVGATTPSTGAFTTITGTTLPAASTSTDIVVSNGGALETRTAASLNGSVAVSTDATLTGDGTTGSPLGVDLANANTWTATQTLPTTAAQGDALIASTNAGATTVDAARIGTGLTDAQVDNDLTINGGTVDATPVGATTPSTGAFTTITGTTLPSTSTSTDIVVSNAGALETRTAASLNGSVAVSTDATLTGDGTTGSPLGLDLANANTWTADQTLPTTQAQGDALIASTNAGTTTIDAARIGTGLTDAQVDNDLTIDGGTVDATPVGATTPSTGAFTTIDAQSAGNVIGDGTNAEQLQIDGVNGTTAEVDIDGDVDVSGSVLVNMGGTFVTNSRLTVNDGHWTSEQTTDPTIAGTTGGFGAANLVAGSTDVAGSVTATSTAGGGAGTFTVTFNLAYATAPIVVLTTADANAAGSSLFVTSTTTTFTVNTTAAAGSVAHTYNYHVIEAR